MPPTWESPAHDVYPVARDLGVIDLGSDGLAVIAVASTVTFALRTPAEQEALVAGFGRYLHSLTAPVQVLIRTQRLDLSGQITDLLTGAAGLPDPGLTRLAHDHAGFLADLAARTELLRRQVLLVWREPTTPHRHHPSRHHPGEGRRRTWQHRRHGPADRRGPADPPRRRGCRTPGPDRDHPHPARPRPAGAVLTAACNPGSRNLPPRTQPVPATPSPPPLRASNPGAADAGSGRGQARQAWNDDADDDAVEDANHSGGWRR